MINLAYILSGKPIKVCSQIFFYQPTLQDIIEVGEDNYWRFMNLWLIKRKDMLTEENEETLKIDDYTIWKSSILSTPQLQTTLRLALEFLLHEKVEFFEISGTIYIGEKGSGIVLDQTFYLSMKEICQRLMPDSSASEEGSQYRETEHMSDREREMIRKMNASAKKIEEVKNPNKKPEDQLGNRILGLVAVGGYTFEQVYNMTMLQFNLLLQKYVDIQSFELRTELSPYINSEEGQSNKFWLD